MNFPIALMCGFAGFAIGMPVGAVTVNAIWKDEMREVATGGVRSPGAAASDYVNAAASTQPVATAPYNPATPGQRTYDDLSAACKQAGGYLWCHDDVPSCHVVRDSAMVPPP